MAVPLLPHHQRSLLPALHHSLYIPSRTSMSTPPHVSTPMCQEQRHPTSLLNSLKHIPLGPAVLAASSPAPTC